MIDFAIKIENVTKTYVLNSASHSASLRQFAQSFLKTKKPERFNALLDVSCTIYQGESVAIIGKNGAGKSTLLKLLSRITPPTDGQIMLNGRVSSLLEIGTGFHPELTGKENIFLNGSVLGMSKTEIQSKMESILEFAGISRHVNQPIKHYSSGMKVRLAFAVAAHLEPDILMIDEVLAVGDIEFQEKCISKMKELASKGKTLVFISHNRALSSRLCKRGVVLEKGQLVYDGGIEDSLAFYQEKVVKSAPMTERLLSSQRHIGNRKFTFSRIWLENKEGNRKFDVKSGDHLSICVEVDSLEQVEANVTCRIYNSSETRITSLTSSYFKQKIEVGASTIISWHIPKLALTDGKYRLELAAYEDFNGQILIDEVTSALWISIEESAYHGHEVSSSPGKNMVYFDFNVSSKNN